MRTPKVILAGVLAVLLGGGLARAAGFEVYEQGAKASGQAGAFVARADDPSAIFYNPAGIVQLEGTWFTIGASAVTLGNGEFLQFGRGNERSDQEGNILGRPTIYFTHQLSESVVFGAGLYSPFDHKTEWDRNAIGRYVARDTVLHTAAVNPTFAFALGPNWSIAVGGSWVYADLRMTRNLDFSGVPTALCPDIDSDGTFNHPCADGFASLEDETDGWGGNVGLQFRSDRGVYWGLSWRSQVTLEFDDLDAEFRDVAPGVSPAFCGGFNCFPNQRASTRIRLPQMAAMGIGTQQERWGLELDVVLRDWEAFETLEIDYERNTPLLGDLELRQDWERSYSYRLGAAWRPNDNYEWRAGVLYDESPVPDETLGPLFPDSNRFAYQVGYGYTSDSEAFRFDAYIQHVAMDPAITTVNRDGLNGRYSQSRNVIGLMATWSRGR